MITPKTIQNAGNITLADKAGFVPQMGGAMQGWFQPMEFILIEKTISGGFLVESGDAKQSWTSPDGTVVQGALVNFMGILLPEARTLAMENVGQRTWSGYDLYSAPQLDLKADDCVFYKDIQYRVLAKWDYKLYQFMQYFLMQDYTLSGPLVPGLPQ